MIDKINEKEINEIVEEDENRIPFEILAQKVGERASGLGPAFVGVTRVGISSLMVDTDLDEIQSYLSELYCIAEHENGQPCVMYLAENITVEEVREDLLNAGLPGLNQKTLNSIILLQRIETGVLIVLTIY